MSETKPRIAWLSGSYFGRRQMMTKIRQKFAAHDVFVADQSCTVEYLMNQMQSTGCFSEKKLVIVNEMPQFKDSNRAKYIKQLKEVLESLDEDIFVVFNGISSKEKTLLGVAEKIGKVYNYPDVIDRKAAPQWTMDFLRKLGYAIDFNTSNALIDNCGFDSSVNGVGVDMMEMAVSRLILCMPPNKKTVEMDDVELSVFEHQNFIVWDILNAIDAQDYDRCINMMHKVKLLDNDVVQAVTSVMHTLLWKFRLLLFLKDALNFDKDISKAANAALSLRKLRREGVGDKAKMVSDMFKTGESAGQPQTAWNRMSIQQAIEGMYGRQPTISLYTRRDIYRINRAIQHAILHLRTTRSEGEAFLLADIVFMTACKTVDDKNLHKIMNAFEKAQI